MLHRLLDALHEPPLADLLVVPRQEDLRHRWPPKNLRPRVVRVLQKPGGEALLLQRLPRDHARDQPRHGIHDDHCRHLAPGQHVVADGNLVRHEGVDHPLVDPLVPPAQEREAPPPAPAPRRPPACTAGPRGSGRRPCGRDRRLPPGPRRSARASSPCPGPRRRRRHHRHCACPAR